MTHFAGRLPAPVTTAEPVAHEPMRSHSSWIDGPPRRWMAPATPEPSWSCSLAALTTASTSRAVMSPEASSIEAGMRGLRPGRETGTSRRELPDDGVGDAQVGLGDRRLRLRRDDRHARVAARD